MQPSTRTWALRFLSHPHTVSLMCGAAAGAAWIAVCATYWTAFEPVPAARITFASAWALTLAVLWSPRVSAALSRIPHFWRVGAASCGLALWPTWWKAVLSRRELIPLDWYAGAWTSLAAMAIPAVLVLVPMVICGGLLCPGMPWSLSGGERRSSWSFWFGVALSWGVLPTTLFVRFNADQVLLSLSACLLLGAGLSLFLREEESDSSGAAHGHDADAPANLATGWWPLAVSLLGAILVGFSLEAANRTAEQLVIESLPLKLFGWAGFLLGIVASRGSKSKDANQRGRLSAALLVTALAAALVVVLFPLWIRVGIWSSSSLSSMPAIVLGKGLIVAGILFPLGCAAGMLLRGSSNRGWLTASIGVGYALNIALVGSLAMSQLAVVGAAVILGMTLWPAEAWRQLTARRGLNRNAGRLATAAGLIAVTLACSGWLNPARSAGLLFNGDTFIAAGNGLDLPTIERSDRSRCLKTIEGENGVLTIWRQRANQLIVRRNGVLSGQMSIDNTLGPQNFWSVMTAAVPLVLHPQADDILCLGTSGFVEVNTVLGFPVRSLTCVEADRETRSLIEYEASLSGSTARLQDGRLDWVCATPMQFASSTVRRTFDVIVCPEATAVPLRSQPRLTREFHVSLARHLNDRGIFCQRMNILDFGSTPLNDTLRSLQSVFKQTCIVTSEGSEVLLIATNSPDPIFEPGIVSRLDTPHVRKLCGTLGGDWSIITQLACMTADKVEELVAVSTGRVNSCSNARFTMQLGSETLRWGPKWKEKQRLFGSRTDLVLKALGLEEEAELTIARRIQDTQQRTRILTTQAEDQWSYRVALKDALLERPRTTIQKVHHEIRQTLAADDKHRKEYLVALGQAARDATPALDAIERVENFAEPYDPLLTDFVHFEVAHLLGRTEPSDPAREYHHWMYCVGYAPQGDHSARPVAAALNLLRLHPEIEADPASRWDQLSFLLDVMRTRWAGRWQAVLPSKYEAADMQHSLEAVTATLTAMDHLREAAEIDRDTWKVQRRIWEDSLVAPTRARQGNTDPQNQMLENVRQEVQRRKSAAGETK